MKLNLGAGATVVPGFTNLDGATGDSIYPLSLAYKDVDAIRASHVLEHFGTQESQLVLKDWVSCLKIGGTLAIAVPDFTVLIRFMNRGLELPYESYIMGGQTDERDFHKSLWNERKLRLFMEAVGLKNIHTWASEIDDCAKYPFSLNLRGTK